MNTIFTQNRSFSGAAALLGLTLLLVFLNVQPLKAVDCAVPSAQYATIRSAVDDPGCDVVNVSSGTFYERLFINRPLILKGAEDAATIIDGIAGGSVLTIKTTAVTLQDLTISNGSANQGGGIFNDGTDLSIFNCLVDENFVSGAGGGIYSKQADLDISDSAITSNAADTGGGVYVESGTINITNSTIGGNEADFHAGGLYLGPETETILTRTSVQDNTCYVDGGGIFNSGALIIKNSSIRNNKSTNYSGGAIRIENGTVYINNSTISKNRSTIGGAIDSWAGALRISSSTISQNEGSPVLDNYSGNVRIKNTIISGNPAQDCKGIIRSDGYNLVSDTQNCDFRSADGDLLNISAVLGGLQGNPAYHPLRFGPGINAGNPDGCTDHLGQLLDTDQLGQPRQGICDMGAFEYQGKYRQVFMPVTMSYVCLDFFDDFSDARSGWPAGEDDYVQFGYKQGEYQIRSKDDDYLYLFSSPSCERENFTIETDARWADDPGLAYGIVFSVKGDFDQYYLFAINSEYQVFWLDYRAPSGWTTLVEPIQTGHINKDQGKNHLQIERNGEQINLSINGQLVRQLRDSHINGLVGSGLFAAAYDGYPHADARFDSFSSRNLVENGRSAPAQNANLVEMKENKNWLNNLNIGK